MEVLGLSITYEERYNVSRAYIAVTTVDLVTFCYPSDIHRAYAGLATLVASFKYSFDEVILIREDSREIDVGMSSCPCRVLDREDYPWEDICRDFGVIPEDPAAERATAEQHFFGKRYYWKDFLWKELIGLKASCAEYVVFINCDCLLVEDSPNDSWVDRGLRALQSDRSILFVSPNQRQANEGDFKTRDFSTILMLAERQRLLGLNYNAPIPEHLCLGWDAFRRAHNYFFEGRLWRQAILHDEYRMVLAGPPWLLHLDWRPDNE
jgi:hypothetical protein